MKLRIMSDLHLEFFPQGVWYKIPPLPDDKDTVLILAGDICVAAKHQHMEEQFQPFIRDCMNRFDYVIMILGNHEHYGSNLLGFHNAYSTILTHVNNAGADQSNFRLLDNNCIIFPQHDVTVIGSTLWTSMDKPHASIYWNSMYDSKQIHSGNKSGFSAKEAQEEHEICIDHIMDMAKNPHTNKLVMVTHHAPSFKSVHQRFKAPEHAMMNQFFASDLDLFAADINPIYWIHGHMHDACRYKLDETICQTEVICNPRGYPGEGQMTGNKFDPLLTIEI